MADFHYTIRQLTNSNIPLGASYPVISGNNVLWQQFNDYASLDVGLYLYKGSGEPIEIATNTYGSNFPDIYENRIAWEAFDGDTQEIYFYNGNSVIQLTDNNLEDNKPQVSPNYVIWTQWDGGDFNSHEIVIYDGSVRKLTNDNYPDYDLRVLENNAVWIKMYRDNDPTPDDPTDLFWFNGSSIVNITENFGHISENPHIFGNTIVWTEKFYQYNGPGDVEIQREFYRYNGSDRTLIDVKNARGYEQLSNINGVDIEYMIDEDFILHDYGRGVYFYDTSSNMITPIITSNELVFFTVEGSEDKVLIHANSGIPNNPSPIDGLYIYQNGSIGQLTQFTSSDTSIAFDPHISGNKVVWWTYPNANQMDTAQVFLAEFSNLEAPISETINLDGGGGVYNFSDRIQNLTVIGTESDEEVTTGYGDDIFDLKGGDNRGNGLGGNDTFIGNGISGFNNIFDGGEGFDRALYNGQMSSYPIRVENGLLKIGSNTDTLISIEEIQFSDQTVSAEELINNNSNLLDDPLFRFQNSDRSGTYLFAGEEESISIRKDYSPPFVEEGFAFNISYTPKEGLTRFNRFQNKIISGTYLFASEEESVSIRQNYSETFKEEGIAFYALGASANQGVDVFRFRNTQIEGTYLFALAEEATSIRQNYSHTFVEEGIAFEVST
ncbi:hypothetical protein [Cyanobacterium sp. Dongsha4]|uniref:hypothetical protein n=1 Tax=Cyanobacterium sp. DS4 TaxID=2878255 RepID=UPI002E814306|nr:hypothetical protein [Cyanobacterium sp. Dongsha4]WVK99652.1 hypothetical protein Dongsha4_13320 [Cyanobacterium sp. Dongsha4]